MRIPVAVLGSLVSLTALQPAGTMAQHAREPRLPAGFGATTLVENINAATALTVAPDGRVFYAEQTGAIRVVKDDRLLPTPALDIGSKLDTWWERGLIGITLHPDFPQSPYLFAVYVAKAPHTHHVVSRFTVVGNLIDAASELVLLEGDDQSTLGGHVPAGHQGGPICFGHDGLLYIGIGEQTAGAPSQSLQTLQGKILRIQPDGGIPEDNPFYGKTTGKYRSIYAIGIRNPFGLAVHPGTGRLFETDVGASAFEEINEIVAGGNYGWPKAEGFTDEATFRNPLHAYPPAIGRSICGGAFLNPGIAFDSPWFGQWENKLIFADWANHWVKAIDIEAPEKLLPFGEGFAAPVGLAVSPDNSIYVLNRNTRWRDGKVFKENSGSLVRIRSGFAGGDSKAISPPAPTLGKTGFFESLRPLKPAHEFHAFELNAPVWLPGVRARRWIRIPGGQSIGMSATDHWGFPDGSVVIQHFDTEEMRPHETHVYIAHENRFRATAYRWSEDGSDPRWIDETEIVPLPEQKELHWISPASEGWFDPEAAIVGFLLQLNTRQLNVGTQLREWRERGWLDPTMTDERIANLPRLAGLDNTDAPIETRVRSYLDSNCASCHRPGGLSRGNFDARFMAASSDQGMILGGAVAGDLGIAGAKIIVPGSPETSLLYQRVKRDDAFRMPPVAVNALPSPVLPLMERWIREMKPGSRRVRLTEDAVDESAGGLPAYRIETPNATYYLEKSGAGLSSFLDTDGNDWLGFHPRPGSGAGGEYRGFPNAVHQQSGNYFHAQNAGTDLSTTEVIRNDPGHVTITATGDNGLWACRYDFTATFCTFTMTRMAQGKRFWALYEGVPGGSYENEDWWMTSASEEKRTMNETHEGDIPGPEWIAFGDPRLKRALVLFHHEDDAHPDRFYQMHEKMTVFGFGRKGIDKFLDTVPQSISIGLVETDAHAEIGEAVATLGAAGFGSATLR